MHANAATDHALTKRVCEIPIDLETSEASTVMPQPVCRETRTRSNFENVVSQFNAFKRPGQDFSFEFLFPPA